MQSLRLSDYDYNLPEASIAVYPPEVRGSSKLLRLNRATGVIEHSKYSELDQFLEAGDVLVLNNTKVIPARVIARNSKGKDIEFILLENHGEESSFNFDALHRGKIREKEMLFAGKIKIEVSKILGNGVVRLRSTVKQADLAKFVGDVPIPPYLHRPAEAIDKERYQTVFAQNTGSVAAPTASLNFTDALKTKLEAKGVIIKYLTLHVGLGTFLPIRSDDLRDHKMHSEYFVVPAETVAAIQTAKRAGKKITALGTTVTRTLEFNAERILAGEPATLRGEANIFIYPGYEFKVIDRLVTNFHAPKSTVLMLTAAFTGWKNLKSAYEEALEDNYKFLSYGDSMLVG